MLSSPFERPRVLAWETTRRCPLRCRHCRAAACDRTYAGELTTDECRRVIDSLAPRPRQGAPLPSSAPETAVARPPMIIWTGGEPMTRPDLVELVRHATARGIRSVLAPCGTLVTAARLRELKDAGIMACSFSLDGPDQATHDAFRGVDGAWDAITGAMRTAREVGMPFQVNATVSKLNLDRLDEIYAVAMSLGATRLDVFNLVPTGRGREIDGLVLSDAETDRVIAWSKAHTCKLTCCPRAGTCIGGRGFAFLSHVGNLQTCGFVDVPCGNIRDFDYDFNALCAAASNPLGVRGNCRTGTSER